MNIFRLIEGLIGSFAIITGFLWGHQMLQIGGIAIIILILLLEYFESKAVAK